MKKIFLSIFVALIACSSILCGGLFLFGDSKKNDDEISARDTYIIFSQEDWDVFKEAVEGGENFSGDEVILLCDIDTSTVEGTFCGVLHGNGQYIMCTGGLFLYGDGAQINNLNIEVNVDRHYYESGRLCAGGVFVFAASCSVIDCYINVHADAPGSHVDYFGAVFGWAMYDCYVERCTVMCNPSYVGAYYGEGLIAGNGNVYAYYWSGESEMREPGPYVETWEDDESYAGMPFQEYAFEIVVTYDANGGTIASSDYSWQGSGSSVTQSYIIPGDWWYTVMPTPTRSGYIFDGWFTSDGTEVSQDDELVEYANHTLYAHWTSNITYYLYFNANGGTGTTPTTISGTAGTTFTLPTHSLTRAGYTANGWNTTGVCTASPNYANGATFTLDSTITLYVNWVPKAKSVTMGFKFYENSAWDTTARSGFSYQVSYMTTNIAGSTNNTAAGVGTYTSARTTTMRAAYTITIKNIVCPEGWVCLGYVVGSNTPPTSASAAFTTGSYALADNTTAETIYVCFKYVGQTLKYDAVDKFFYFEDGEFPQTAVVTYDSNFNTDLTNSIASSTNSFVSNGITFYVMDFTYDSSKTYTSSYAATYDGQRFLGFSMPATSTIKLKYDIASSRTFSEGTTYWFKYDPIKWRVSDYGVSETAMPTAWDQVGENRLIAKIVSEVLWWDILNEEDNEIGVGNNALQTSMAQKLSLGAFVGGMNIENDYGEAYLGDKVDEFVSPAVGNSKVDQGEFSVKMRYIKFIANGSTANAGNHVSQISIANADWDEIALVSAPNSVIGTWTYGGYGLASDATGAHSYINTNSTAILDIGTVQDVAHIYLRRYYPDSRKYYSQKIMYSVDGTTWYTFWDSGNKGSYGNHDDTNLYKETSAGRWFNIGEGARLASVSEIEGYQSDMKCYGSQLAAVLSGQDQTKPIEYWTRDFGQQIGCGTYVNEYGRVLKNSYYNTAKGVRFSMVMRDAGYDGNANLNLYGLGNMGITTPGVINSDNTLTYEYTYSGTSVAYRNFFNYTVPDEFEVGATYLYVLDVKEFSSSTGSIEFWVGDTNAGTQAAALSYKTFTVTGTGVYSFILRGRNHDSYWCFSRDFMVINAGQSIDVTFKVGVYKISS